VTPDGRHFVFTTLQALTGVSHGSCNLSIGIGCREVYLFDADTGRLACASCPSRGPAMQSASVLVREHQVAAQASRRDNRALSADGSRVFFSTAEALVPEDVNGVSDAYEFDADARTVSLLSSGRDSDDSWFVDASIDGDDAFILTRERLVGWDVDNAYDIYDARVGGGFPEPPTPTVCGSPETCRTAGSVPAPYANSGSSVLAGSGNARPGRPRGCRRGFVRKRVRGKRRCVRRPGCRRRGGKRTRRCTRAGVSR